MKKVFFIIGLSLIATVGLSGCFGPFKKQEQDNQQASQTEDAETSSSDEQTENEDGNYFETMKDLMERGKSMRCTYTQKIDESGEIATGVIYMADKSARTEITIKEGADSVGKMHAIVDQEWTYSWVEGSSKGFKMTLEASELSEKNEEAVSDMSKEIDFECKSWKKDNSKFKAPANIEFQDMSEIMGGLGDMDLEKELKDAEIAGNEMLCEMCKNAPTPELVAECLGDIVCD